MKPRWAFTVLFSLVGTTLITLLEQKPSFAWMEICNRTPDKLNLSFAYLEKTEKENPEKDKPEKKKSEKKQNKEKENWIAQGWWNVEPGKCTKVYPHALWQKGRYYYFYAKNSQETKKWYGEGKKSFCIKDDDFKQPQNDIDKEKCVNQKDKLPTVCEDKNELECTERKKEKTPKTSYWQQFGLIDIGGKKIENHTLNLK